MKATKSNSPPAEQNNRFRRLAQFFAVISLIAVIIAILPQSAPRATMAPTNKFGMTGYGYFRSGQLLADARTLVCMMEYILQPDGPAAPVTTEIRSQPLNLATTVNEAVGGSTDGS